MKDFLLLFDLDGTLIDSVPDIHAAIDRMLQERGRQPLPEAQVKRMIGDGAPMLVARALAASGDDPNDAAALTRFTEIYTADPARLTRPYPGVVETIAALRGRGYRTGICTNKPQRATMAVLGALDLLSLIDGIAGGDYFPVKKPDPGHLLGLMRELGAAPGATAMIGDNEHDAAAGRGAGLKVVLMRYGYARVDVESLGVDALLDHFADLPAALDRLGLGKG